MKKTTIAIVLATAGMGGAACAGGSAHWGYSGDEGPEQWGELSKDYVMCGAGSNQSPINLSGFIEAELEPIGFKYGAGGYEVLNNGHTVQVNYRGGSNIRVDGQDFELKQFHFHSPSENHIDGQSFPMEAHFVHADAKGNLAVVAVMFKQGEENKALSAVWKQMPMHAGDKEQLHETVVASSLLPRGKEYYRFNGSLTTPPCSEGVRWLVMKDAVTVSAEQLKHFGAALHEPNNRPIQAVNARPVLQ